MSDVLSWPIMWIILSNFGPQAQSSPPPNFPSDLRHCCLGPFVSQMEYDANRSCAPCVWWSAGLAWCAAVLRKRRRCERCPTVWSCHSAAAPDEDAGRETPSLSYDCENLPRAVCRTTCLCDPRLYASSKAVRQWQRIEMQIRVHNPHRRRLHRSLREGGGGHVPPQLLQMAGHGGHREWKNSKQETGPNCYVLTIMRALTTKTTNCTCRAKSPGRVLPFSNSL